MARSLIYGEHIRIERVLMHRDKTPTANYHRSVQIDNKNYKLFKNYPLYPMSLSLFFNLSTIEKLAIAPQLIRLNKMKHAEYKRFLKSFTY